MKYSAISALLLASTLPIAANAAPVCDQREKFLETLRKLYSEDLSAIGVTAEGKLVELLVSDGGTWTILLTSPNGRSCAVSAGKGWSRTPEDAGALQFSLF